MSGMGTHGTYNDIWSTDIVGGDAKAVFYMMFGSWLGEWDSTDDIMRSVLATSSMGLTCSWAGRPHWYYHHMGLGEPIGYSARLSQNNAGMYQNQVNQFLRGIHIALMGDPTLRLHQVAPPSGVSASTAASGVNLNWSASPDTVVGYHVYRASDPAGPFTRLTSSPVTSTSFSDSGASAGTATYMVRAIKLESTPSGSYFNASQAAFLNGASSGNSTPSVTISSPGGGSTVSGAGVSVSATVLNIPNLAGVQFKLDNANLGAQDTTAPFTVSWDTTKTSNGSHTLSATATDSAGAQTTAATISVTVNNSTGGATNPPPTNGVFWVDDAVPAGAIPGADGGDGWTWISSNPAPFSGTLANQSNIGAGLHEHYFDWANATLSINTGDVLVAYTYLDPANLPTEIMLQWNDGTWEHRAFWGANNILNGVNGTAGRFFMGALPAAGQWVRLDVQARQVGLEGSTVKGMAFSLFDGRATWDAAGKASTQTTGNGTDTIPPRVAITAPTNNTIISGSAVLVSASASDNIGVVGVQFNLDGANLGAEDAVAPYSTTLNTLTLTNGAHSLLAIARDAAGNRATSAVVSVLVGNVAAPPPANTNTDIVWFDDSLPGNAVQGSDGGDGWNWVTSNPTPFSGTMAHQSNLAPTNHQHYFSYAWATLRVNTGDVLFAYVYLDPANIPLELMLQWDEASWEHRAYWGASINSYGVEGTASRHYMGPLPAAGQWVRLEIPARLVGLEGTTLKGMAFTLFGGRATWDYVGKRASSAMSIKRVAQGMTIAWPSEIGQSYRVLCNTNLMGTNWTDISGVITATNSNASWMDTTTSGDPQRFYKVVQ
jgi:hypothetical protein